MEEGLGTMVGSDDLLDFCLDEESTHTSVTVNVNVNGGSSSLVPPAEVEEELEWLYAFPPVEFGFLPNDNPLDAFGILRHHSPDSVLLGDKSASQGLFQHLPSGFPYFARKKRIQRKPRRTGFANAQEEEEEDKHLLLLGHQICLLDVRNYSREPPPPILGRRCCLHCATDTTPKWRVGPMGPKTLCNACGVRFHSGRLVPEYRPASSPTFSTKLHSNSHRKIVKMRKQKQVVGMVKAAAL